MLYFASSYFFVHLEAEYKRQLHVRMASAMGRLRSYSNTIGLLADATAAAAELERFAFPALEGGTACGSGAQKPRLLVLSSYWDRGHSSHRITGPLSAALARHACAYVVHAVSGEVWTAIAAAEERGAANASASGATPEAAAAAGAAAGAVAREERLKRHYEDAPGFLARSMFPSGDSLKTQLALWATLRSPTQLTGNGAPAPTQLSDGRLVDPLLLQLADDLAAEERVAPGLAQRFMSAEDRAALLLAASVGRTPAPATPPRLFPFDGVLYPSVGMSPNDMMLASLRVARVQMVTYGHSSSSQSPTMDVFLGGLEPEVLGPFVADIYRFDVSCARGPDALAALLRLSLREGGVGTGDAGAGGGLFVGSTARGHPLRLPRVTLCEGADASGAANSGVCSLLDEYVVRPLPVGVASGDLRGAATAALTVGEALGVSPLSPLPASLRLPPQCASTLPLDEPLAAAMYTRLVDAQRRYSERLVLLPGLGLWFTAVFPLYAPAARAPMPPTDAPHELPSLHAAAALFGDLLGAAPGATAAGEAAAAALAAPGVGAHTVVAAAAAVPWPGVNASRPVNVGLVWSVVKWNARHLDRLLAALHAARAAWAGAWARCAGLVADAAATGAASAPSGASPQLLVCATLISRFPPACAHCGAPPLHLRVVGFSSSDGDTLKAAAFHSWLRRLFAGEFPDGAVAVAFVTNATTPASYYGQLGAMDLIFDSLPFAACNTMQDALALRVPIVSAAHDGEFEPGTGSPLRWRSTIGASILTRLGLSGLAAAGERDLLGKAAHLIANPLLRAAWRVRMADAPDGDLSRVDYADRDAQLVAMLLRTTPSV